MRMGAKWAASKAAGQLRQKQDNGDGKSAVKATPTAMAVAMVVGAVAASTGVVGQGQQEWQQKRQQEWQQK